MIYSLSMTDTYYSFPNYPRPLVFASCRFLDLRFHFVSRLEPRDLCGLHEGPYQKSSHVGEPSVTPEHLIPSKDLAPELYSWKGKKIPTNCKRKLRRRLFLV